MFTDFITPLQAAWLLGLLIAWASLLFGGLLWPKPQPGRAGRMPAQTRLLSSLALVIAGWSWAFASMNSATAGYAILIAAGMTLGFVGDLAMAGVLLGSRAVFAGMGAFGLGHLAYIAAGLLFENEHGLTATGPRFGAWAVWLLIGAVGWYLAVMRNRQRRTLQWVALPYALLLASTTGVATGLTLQTGILLPFAVGATLFLVSDLILAAGLFGEARFRRSDDVIWLTYGPGQMLIVYSIGSALRLAG